MRRLDPDRVDTIVIHITVSDYGDVETVDRWHKDRGWEAIGYHFLITNCFPSRKRWELKRPDPSSDGVGYTGRSTEFAGAHVKGHNSHSIGVAMVGKKGAFTSKQLDQAVKICIQMKKDFPNITKIVGHFELFDGKSCPDLDMDLFREMVETAEA